MSESVARGMHRRFDDELHELTEEALHDNIVNDRSCAGGPTGALAPKPPVGAGAPRRPAPTGNHDTNGEVHVHSR